MQYSGTASFSALCSFEGTCRRITPVHIVVVDHCPDRTSAGQLRVGCPSLILCRTSTAAVAIRIIVEPPYVQALAAYVHVTPSMTWSRKCRRPRPLRRPGSQHHHRTERA